MNCIATLLWLKDADTCIECYRLYIRHVCWRVAQFTAGPFITLHPNSLYLLQQVYMYIYIYVRCPCVR